MTGTVSCATRTGRRWPRMRPCSPSLKHRAEAIGSLANPDELQEVELRRASALMGIGLYHMRPGQKPVTGGNDSEGVNFDAANKHFTDAAALLRTLRANAPARSVRLLQATRALQVCLVDHAQLFHNASTRADGRVENLPLLKQAVDLYDEGKSVPQEKRADDHRFKAVWKRRDRAKKDVLPLYYSNYIVFSLGQSRDLGPHAAQISMLVTIASTTSPSTPVESEIPWISSLEGRASPPCPDKSLSLPSQSN